MDVAPGGWMGRVWMDGIWVALGIEHLRVIMMQCSVKRAPFRGMKLFICINDHLLHWYDKDGKGCTIGRVETC